MDATAQFVRETPGGDAGSDADRLEAYEPSAASFVGVKALMLAVLEDAVRAYLGPNRRDREEAGMWMAHTCSHWVFSFPVVCETLHLDPLAVRAAVIRMGERDGASVPPPRSRPNVQRHGALQIR